MRGVRGAVEMGERGAEFGGGESGLEEEEGREGGRGYYWARTDDGRVGVRFGRIKEEEEGGGEGGAESVVDVLKEIGRDEVRSGLFLRWLDELGVLRDRSRTKRDVESAKRYVWVSASFIFWLGVMADRGSGFCGSCC